MVWSLVKEEGTLQLEDERMDHLKCVICALICKSIFKIGSSATGSFFFKHNNSLTYHKVRITKKDHLIITLEKNKVANMKVIINLNVYISFILIVVLPWFISHDLVNNVKIVAKK